MHAVPAVPALTSHAPTTVTAMTAMTAAFTVITNVVKAVISEVVKQQIGRILRPSYHAGRGRTVAGVHYQAVSESGGGDDGYWILLSACWSLCLRPSYHAGGAHIASPNVTRPRVNWAKRYAAERDMHGPG